MKEAKQIIIIRKDLNMRRGKQIAQGAHASLGVILDMMSSISEYAGTIHKFSERRLLIKRETPLKAWLDGPFTKICCYVNSKDELIELYEKAKKADIPCSFIEDIGLTEFKGVKTATCIAIGPGWIEDIDKITKHLPLL